ncbi:MAG TPA: response regulator [Aggregatilineales bacterium]|nr:response regulator [Aggregatilineales bacterium]
MSDKRALIVDDDFANRSIWELVLSENGYEVASAETVSDGMGRVGEDISLYLVDYHLPDGHGTDLVSYVRQNFPSTVVVMVSMDDDADVIREGIRAGGNVFMVKPTSPAVMGQVLAEIESGSLSSSDKQLINRHGRRVYNQ